MNEITSINDEYLHRICDTASISAMDLLQYFEFKSSEWFLHTGGLSYGIWISICDPLEVTLDEIDELINEMVTSHLN